MPTWAFFKGIAWEMRMSVWQSGIFGIIDSHIWGAERLISSQMLL